MRCVRPARPRKRSRLVAHRRGHRRSVRWRAFAATPSRFVAYLQTRLPDAARLHALGLKLPPPDAELGDAPDMPDVEAPELGRTHLERSFPPRVAAALRGRLCWGWDLFELGEACAAEGSAPGPLCTLATVLFEDHGLCDAFSIPHETLVSYFCALEARYQAVAYHNSLHAADVLHAMNFILVAGGAASSLPRVELAAALLAAAAHDVGHSGVGNAFLVATRAPLALRYNDVQVLENFHAATAFELLAQPGCDLTAAMSAADARALRSLTVSLILATDVAQHGVMMAQAAPRLARPGGLRLDGSGAADERSLALALALKCADVGNSSKSVRHALRWGLAIMAEFFAEGDARRALCLPVSPSCDRERVNVAHAQLSFLDGLALPLYETLATLLPRVGAPALARTRRTRAFIASCIEAHT